MYKDSNPFLCSKNGFCFNFHKETHLYILGLPDSVKNCSLKTLKSMAIKITCIPGLSGGLEQWFVLKVS